MSGVITNGNDLLDSTNYKIENGRLCYLKPLSGGRPEFETVALCNFVAQCTEEIILDDGRQPIRHLVIEGRLDYGQPLPEITIKASDFSNMQWVTKEWGIVANITAGWGMRDKLRDAIQTLSRQAKWRTVYTHSGWRKINGVWVFLHAGGAIEGPDWVEVNLGSELARYSLPEPGGAEAAEASLRLLDVAPWEITAPLIACVYLAPLAGLLMVDFTLWLLGQTGSFKSTLAALALSHFGDFDRTSLPGSWASTANALERRTFVLKDMLFVVDDFAPPSDAKVASELEQKAHRIIRGAGNRAGRQRLTADMTEYQTYDPRCLIISNGEMLPTGQSIAARCLVVKVDQNLVDKARLSAAQSEKHLYAKAMSAYISSLAPDLDELLPKLQVLWSGFRNLAQARAHPRVPEMVAYLALGFEMFLNFQVSMGTINFDRAGEMRAHAWQTFNNLGRANDLIIEEERPSLHFLNILRELFSQKRVHVRALSGGPPMINGQQAWEVLGWQSQNAPGNYNEHVGWCDGENLYLMPDASYKIVSEFMRRQGSYCVSKKALFKALTDDGFIEPNPNGENTVVKKIQGCSKRILVMQAETIFN